MYRHGQGVEENIEEAVSHYRKGAEAGDPFAHLSLAHCYTHGKGVEQSYGKAVEQHLKASESGGTDGWVVGRATPLRHLP